MGQQSNTHPYSAGRLLLWMALVFLSAAQALSQAVDAISLPLLLPSALVFDAEGNLYLAETGNHVIRKVDLQGHVTTFAGSGVQGFAGDSGLATQAQLDSPQGLALGGNVLYIADTHNNRIRVVNLTTNLITTLAGGSAGFGGDSSAVAKALLNLPTALALDAKGNLYLADTGNHRIRRVEASTGLISTVAGDGSQGYSGDNGPAVSAGIDSPSGIAVDAFDNLYLADTHNNRIRRIAASSGIITTIAGTGTLGSGVSQLALPQGLTLDAQGNVYLADTANHRIRRIDAVTGAVTTIAGTGTQGYAGDGGPGIAANLDSPRAVTLAPGTQLTISDTHNQRVRQLSPNSIETIAGVGGLTPGTLTLNAPAVITYGTGQVAATLKGATPASGGITFLDTYLGATTTQGVIPVVANAARLSLTQLSAGVHSLTATYPGDAAHAAAQSMALALTVSPAPTITNLSVSSASTQPITVVAKTVSGTSGTPTGIVTLHGSGVPVGSAALTAASAASVVLPTLAPGTYNLTASYAGDNNFLPSISSPVDLTIAPATISAADFSLFASAPTSQTIAAGSSATYSFTAQTQGLLSSVITLNASGLPAGATATFSPTYLPPGSLSNPFTLTVTTLKPAVRLSAGGVIPVAICTLLLSWLQRTRRDQGRLGCGATSTLVAIALFCWITLTCTACGDRVSTANSQALTQPAAYSITVTATATGTAGTVLIHSTNVTLTLQ